HWSLLRRGGIACATDGGSVQGVHARSVSATTGRSDPAGCDGRATGGAGVGRMAEDRVTVPPPARLWTLSPTATPPTVPTTSATVPATVRRTRGELTAANLRPAAGAI